MARAAILQGRDLEKKASGTESSRNLHRVLLKSSAKRGSAQTHEETARSQRMDPPERNRENNLWSSTGPGMIHAATSQGRKPCNSRGCRLDVPHTLPAAICNGSKKPTEVP